MVVLVEGRVLHLSIAVRLFGGHKNMRTRWKTFLFFNVSLISSILIFWFWYCFIIGHWDKNPSPFLNRAWKRWISVILWKGFSKIFYTKYLIRQWFINVPEYLIIVIIFKKNCFRQPEKDYIWGLFVCVFI